MNLSRGRLCALLIASSCTCLIVGSVVGTGGRVIGEASPDVPLCGHTCVWRCCELLGIPVELETIVNALPPSEGTNSFAQLSDFLIQQGLACTAEKRPIDQLSAGPFPAIVHLWHPDHFIVVSRVEGGRVHLFDSFGDRIAINLDSLASRWSGYILYVSRDLGAIRKPQASPVGAAPSAQVRFETLLLDRGDVPAAGQRVSFIYPFHNVGDGELTIRQAQLSCTCLDFNAPSTPVAPGEKGFVELIYRSRAVAGPFFQEAIVETNDPSHPFLKLKAVGFSDTGITVVPSRIDLGEIPLGRTKVFACFVKCAADHPGFSVKASSSIEGMQTKVYSTTQGDLARKWWPDADASFRAAPGTQVVELAFTPTRLGTIDRQVIVRTNVRGFEEITIQIAATVVGPVTIWPGVLSFGESESHEHLRRTVTLVSLVGDPFQVLGVEPDAPGLICSFSEDVIQEVVPIRFESTGAVASQLSGSTLHVRLHIPGRGADVRVPLPIFAHLRRRDGDE